MSESRHPLDSEEELHCARVMQVFPPAVPTVLCTPALLLPRSCCSASGSFPQFLLFPQVSGFTAILLSTFTDLLSCRGVLTPKATGYPATHFAFFTLSKLVLCMHLSLICSLMSPRAERESGPVGVKGAYALVKRLFGDGSLSHLYTVQSPGHSPGGSLLFPQLALAGLCYALCLSP